MDETPDGHIETRSSEPSGMGVNGIPLGDSYDPFRDPYGDWPALPDLD